MRISDWSSDVCSSDLVRNRMTQTDVSMELIAENIRQMSSRASAIAESAGNQTSATNVINDAAARAAAGSQQVSHTAEDRKSVVSGKSVSVRVDLGCRRSIKQQSTHDS